jgi:hypothetical protein
MYKLPYPRPIQSMLEISTSFEKSDSALWTTVQNEIQSRMSANSKLNSKRLLVMKQRPTFGYETEAQVGSSVGKTLVKNLVRPSL